MAIFKGELSQQPTLARVQGAPPPWSFLGKGTCKSSTTAREALEAIDAAGEGALVLMHLDGASESKVRWTFSQDFGGNTDAPVQVQADALRDLGTGCQILLDLGLKELKLLSSSKRPIVGIEAYGLNIVERIQA